MKKNFLHLEGIVYLPKNLSIFQCKKIVLLLQNTYLKNASVATKKFKKKGTGEHRLKK